MVRPLSVFLLFLMAVIQAPAQTSRNWQIGASLEVALPTGNFGSYTGTGFLGMVRLGYYTGPNMLISAGVGWVRFGGRGIDVPVIDVNVPTPGTSIVPLVIGARYLASERSETRPFVGLEGGMYLVSSTLSVAGFNLTGSGNQTFGIAPNAGVQFKAGDKSGITIQGSYTNLMGEGFTPQWVGFGGGANLILGDN